MMPRFILSLVFLLLVIPAISADVSAEERDEIERPSLREIQEFPVSASFDLHSYAFPFGRMVLAPSQPGFTIGTEFTLRSGRWGRLYEPIEFGWYTNRTLSSAIRLQTGIGYRYTAFFGLFFDLAINIGYRHGFHTREVFALNENGRYESVRDSGRPSFIGGFSASIGYTYRRMAHPISIFVRYQWFAHVPYILDEEPVFPHSLLQFGVAINLQRNLERRPSDG